MPGEANGRAALVTGAGQRIGRAMAMALAEDGWAVAVHYRQSAAAARDTVAAIRADGGHAVAVAADLADPAQAAGLVAAARQRLGTGLTCLVNSASRFEFDTGATFSLASWDAHHGINLRAPALLIQAFAADLPAAADGVVINLLDQKLANLNPDFFSYTLSKMGLEGLTTLCAMAFAPRIRVCGIAPGLTLPPPGMDAAAFARAHRQAPLGRGSTVADLVRALRFVIATPTITGTTMIVDGGQHLEPRRHDVMFQLPEAGAPGPGSPA